jgi:hypothetical protein
LQYTFHQHKTGCSLSECPFKVRSTTDREKGLTLLFLQAAEEKKQISFHPSKGILQTLLKIKNYVTVVRRKGLGENKKAPDFASFR